MVCAFTEHSRTAYRRVHRCLQFSMVEKRLTTSLCCRGADGRTCYYYLLYLYLIVRICINARRSPVLVPCIYLCVWLTLTCFSSEGGWIKAVNFSMTGSDEVYYDSKQANRHIVLHKINHFAFTEGFYVGGSTPFGFENTFAVQLPLPCIKLLAVMQIELYKNTTACAPVLLRSSQIIITVYYDSIRCLAILYDSTSHFVCLHTFIYPQQ